MSGFYTTRLIQEKLPDGEIVWYADHPELHGCHAVGNTIEEAQANLERSKEAWLQVAGQRGIDIPPPREHPVLQMQYLYRVDVSETQRTESSATVLATA